MWEVGKEVGNKPVGMGMGDYGRLFGFLLRLFITPARFFFWFAPAVLSCRSSHATGIM